MGYTFFTVPKLTLSEINVLINEHNKRVKEEQKIINRAKRKR